MNKKFLVVAVLLSLGTALSITGCKKETASEPLEPIYLVHPDSSISHPFPGDNVPIEIKFTTDRPINWVKGMYDLDTLLTTGYTPSYPDTLFFVKLDTVVPLVNLYTYTGTYHVPDSLNPYDVIRFKISFEAGKSTFTTGQNYPAGKVSASKEFKLDLR